MADGNMNDGGLTPNGQKTAYLRQPTVNIDFIAENNKYNLSYDTAEQSTIGSEFQKITKGTISEALISLTTVNDMNEDMSSFSLVIAGTQRWDRLLTTNDIVRIKISPGKPAVANDNVMVGMINEVRRVGTYSDASVIYQINGNSMVKALTQLKLGTIQEIAGLGTFGWMTGIPDTDAVNDNSGKVHAPAIGKGLNFSGKKASDVIEQIISWFLFSKSRYNFYNDKSQIREFFMLSLKSHSDEFLTDTTPYTAYQGSLRQMISEAQVKPFNEFYQEFTADGKCLLVLRPTPFEKTPWGELQKKAIPLRTAEVLEETLAQTDVEAYSIFSCSVPSSVVSSTTLASSPKFSQELVDKYGYSMLQVENSYIFQTNAAKESSDDSDGGGDNSSGSFKDISSADVASIITSTLAWTDKKSVTAAKLDKFIKAMSPGSPFVGTGKYFMEAAQASGYNPIYLVAHSGLESAWGASQIGESNNFYGIGAFDNDPNNALHYGNSSIERGIVNGAVWIWKNYFQAGQKSLKTMRHNGGNHEYASDLQWDTKIGGVMASYYKMFGLRPSARVTLSPTLPGDYFNPPVASVKPTIPGLGLIDLDNNGIDDLKEDKDHNFSALGSSTTGNSKRLDLYSHYLYNWYSDNPSFFSGEIRVLGNPDYRIGNVVSRYDNGTKEWWEYYVESVSHEFNRESGYTTTLGVTRGLPKKVDRFKHYYVGAEFKGGIFGELSLSEAYDKAKTESKDDSGDNYADGGTGGYTGSDAIAQKAQEYTKKKSVYRWGGGHGVSEDPLKTSGTIGVDCSAFVSWLYYECNVPGWDKAMGGSQTTFTLVDSSKLTRVTSGSSTDSNSAKKSKLGQGQPGDLIFFDTDGAGSNSHVGIYMGLSKDGNKPYFIGSQGNEGASDSGIQEATLDSGYWLDAFNGKMCRPKNKK